LWILSEDQRFGYRRTIRAVASFTTTSQSSYWMPGKLLIQIVQDRWNFYLKAWLNEQILQCWHHNNCSTCFNFYVVQPHGAAVNNFVIQLALSMVGQLYNHTICFSSFSFSSSLNGLCIAYRLLQKALKFIKLLVMAQSIWLTRYMW